MALVQALDGFEHQGSRKRGQRFSVSTQVARKLRDAGLVAIVGEADTAHPTLAAGNPLSASPAAPALPQMIVSASDAGEIERREFSVEDLAKAYTAPKQRRRKKAAASSS